MKRLFVLILLLAIPSIASAQFNDHDGQLEVTWQPPDYGNPLDYYIWSYTINSVADSVTGTSAAEDTLDNSVTLANVGNWAIFYIHAVSVVSDTSEVVVSDTAYYNEDNLFGFISGVVTDIESIPIEGVHVQAIGTEVDDSSNTDGQYLLNNLQSGIYDILFTHPEFENTLYHDVYVDANDTTILNIVLYEPRGCYYIPGDINGDRNVIGSDVTYGVNYFRGTGNPPPDSCYNQAESEWLYAAADANGDCLLIGSDITYMVMYFRGLNPPPTWCPQTPPANPGLLKSKGQLNPSNILLDP